MEINNFRDFINALNDLGEPKDGHTRFFRGHSKLSYKLEPSIYRLDPDQSPRNPKYLINNEDKIIRDALTSCPDAFKTSDTLFQKLVKLQHYGYATRLLDLTSNALVALYFAAQSGINTDSNDGELIVLDIPDAQIKYDDSDIVSILSAISLRGVDFSVKSYSQWAEFNGLIQLMHYTIKHKNNIIDDELKHEISYLIDRHNDLFSESGLTRFNDCCGRLTTLTDNDPFFKKAVKEVYDKAVMNSFNNQSEIAKLLHDIRHDKPSFAPVIDKEDFSKVVCVRAKLNNPRIIRQQGSFLLFGMNNEKEIKAEVDSDWKRLLSDGSSLVIKSEAKQEILRELKSFGISRQNLFPELDAQAKDIMDKYRCL